LANSMQSADARKRLGGLDQDWRRIGSEPERAQSPRRDGGSCLFGYRLSGQIPLFLFT
jgi:hypothetical protein